MRVEPHLIEDLIDTLTVGVLAPDATLPQMHHPVPKLGAADQSTKGVTGLLVR